MEQRVAALPETERAYVLKDLDIGRLSHDWRGWNARPSQILPKHFSLALAMSGRGFGKTRMGSEWIRWLDTNWADLNRGEGHLRVALLGRTAADVRDTMLNGISGLMNIWPPSLRDHVKYTPSNRSVTLPGGGVCLCFSAEEPDQLRGPAFHIGWADEMASYRQVQGQENLSAWDNLTIATRLGEEPQILATTTPKRVPALKKILADSATDASIIVRRGRTNDNVYLSAPYRKKLFGMYSGTTLGKQELEGEMLDEVAGSMVMQSVIDAYRVTKVPAGYPYIRIVAVDPSVAEKPNDECGIVVIYITQTHPVLGRHAYVVEDLSGQMSPANWGDRVVRAAHRHGAVVVAEINQGMGLVKTNVMQAATHAKLQPPSFRAVWASKAKAVRAEPIGAAFEQGRVHILNHLTELEDQCSGWVAGESGYSPDRMDAMVHGVAAGLFPNALTSGTPGSGQIHTVARTQIDIRHQASFPSRAAARMGRTGV